MLCDEWTVDTGLACCAGWYVRAGDGSCVGRGVAGSGCYLFFVF